MSRRSRITEAELVDAMRLLEADTERAYEGLRGASPAGLTGADLDAFLSEMRTEAGHRRRLIGLTGRSGVKDLFFVHRTYSDSVSASYGGGRCRTIARGPERQSPCPCPKHGKAFGEAAA